MGGKKKAGKAKKGKGEDGDVKEEQKRIIDEIHNADTIEDYPMK